MKISQSNEKIFGAAPGLNHDMGLGDKVARQPGTRLIRTDGTFNVLRRGLSQFAPYQNMVETTWLRFVATTVGLYLACNMIFALGFYLLGPRALAGVPETVTALDRYLQCLYFSMQTFTTVGYGTLAPASMQANALAAVLALFGWMALALVTGLFFARFSRPAQLILFSERAIIAPYRDGMSLQFRIANRRDSNLINLRANLNLTWLDDRDGELRRRFSTLDLERSSVSLFPLNWTVVHPLSTESPLKEWGPSDLREKSVELLVTIEGYDRTYAQQIFVNKSYTAEELEWNVRFLPMYLEQEATTELFLDRISATSPAGEEGKAVVDHPVDGSGGRGTKGTEGAVGEQG
ncbi:ion channel [Lewinella sp. IMCC34183]|uniref:ion channel n=1 Tax=Lewinella sp. IMCC34183 TaxID=2248762 RepID=UPI0018E5044F|nr:ion channel [Lewinella sp. IMCC34183]